MKAIFIIFLVVFSGIISTAQSLEAKLSAAWTQLNKQPQMDFAIAGTYIMNAKNGAKIFERNAHIGLVPASTMKVITSYAAYQLLGTDFSYPLQIGITGNVLNDTLFGNLIIQPSGDPSLGSDRYQQTNAQNILMGITKALRQEKIKVIAGDLIIDSKNFDINPTPEGWIWGDMGNAYGAGHWPLNWQENTFSFYTNNGKPNTAITLNEQTFAVPVVENALAGNVGTGDKSIVYGGPFSEEYLHQGWVEPNKTNFKNNASIPNADVYAMNQMRAYLKSNDIFILGELVNSLDVFKQKIAIEPSKNIYSYQSPKLDSLNYWFMRKSINLYGEALLKSIALKQTGHASTKNGTSVVDSLLLSKTVSKNAVRMLDGSGLTPSSRIAPIALAQVLYQAKSEPWFKSFYNSFPVYNGMNIKSGTMTAVKCYAGYYKDYIVVLMVNNYNGPHAAMVNKMYEFLNTIK